MIVFTFLLAFLCLFCSVQARIQELHREQRRQLNGNVGSNSHSDKDTFCASPVPKAKVQFSSSLAGRSKIDFDMYSGYVNITSSPDYLFYWFFGTRDGNQNAPLIIWTNGGPGCTSMEGATTEHGPLNLFDIKESCSNGGPNSKCDYTGQLSYNPYSWNAHANVLYLDQPKNVGFSFGYGAETSSSTEAAQEFVTFYTNWIELFPEFKGRPLIISGESYGGHYVPAWSSAILDYNENKRSESSIPIPLKAIVIGNGCTNDTVQGTEAFVSFQHEQNLISASANPKTETGAYSEMVSYLGYVPNYYDFRLESVTCSACYSYNYTAWAHWFLQTDVLTALNVCGDAGNDAFAGSAGGCISMGNFDARDSFDYSGALGRALESGVSVTLYYGKTDTACNYVGGQALANSIPWTGSAGFQKASLESWSIGNVEAGQKKAFGGLSLIQVEAAGHMVPLDQPAASASIIAEVLSTLNSST